MEYFEIETKKKDRHKVYEKTINGKVYYVASNHTTKFNPKKVKRLW